MLSIIATVIIAACGVILLCLDNSRIAFGLSFLVLICAGIFAGNNCFLTSIQKLQRLKIMCMISAGLVCFQLCITSFRVRKYLAKGERFSIVTSVIFLIAQLTLILTLHSTKATLKKLNEEQISTISSGNQSSKVWV